MSLNTDQEKAFNEINTLFRKEQEPAAAVLTGAAGTGKTFLTKQLYDSLNPVLSAMTHKAAAIMAKQTNQEVITLAKVLRHKKYDNLTTGKTQFKASNVAKLPDGKTTLFIDESSMMNKENFEQVQNVLMPFYNILFIGDKYQLPPVQEIESLSFSQVCPHYSLIQPMRFSLNSGIDSTAVSIRTAMEKGDTKIAGMREILASHDDVRYVSAKEAAGMMIEDFKAAEDVDDVRMISFTNKRVEEYNFHLKTALTGDATRFKRGDILMANAAFTKSRRNVETGAREDIVVLNNNESVLVKGISESVIDGVPCYIIEIDKGEIIHVPIDRTEFDNRVTNLRLAALKHPSGSSRRSELFKQMFDLKNGFADLRLNYAQTVHKAQGSSYRTCYFDLTSLNSDTLMGKKLLYTGVTRAAKQLILFK